MGLGIGISSTCYDAQPPTGNPNPSNYDVLESEQIGKCLIVKIRYPDCKNYEGVKILVYLGTTLFELRKQKHIDPHFTDDSKYISPVARFVPTKAGMALAKKLAKVING